MAGNLSVSKDKVIRPDTDEIRPEIATSIERLKLIFMVKESGNRMEIEANAQERNISYLSIQNGVMLGIT